MKNIRVFFTQSAKDVYYQNNSNAELLSLAEEIEKQISQKHIGEVSSLLEDLIKLDLITFGGSKCVKFVRLFAKLT